MSELTLSLVNDADEDEFVTLLGDIYEESPWVPERSVSARPFESVDQLRETMRQTVEDATHVEQLSLLCAHPDLGEQTEMTDASKAEQASAGLDELSAEQYERFQRLNETYREKFGFPFIMAVRDETPDAIEAAMERRIDNTDSVEFRTALDQVHEIARLRLADLFDTE